MDEVLGNPSFESNDWVDNQLVAAVYYNAVDFLVSEDNGVLTKAQKLGIRDRIINLDEALEMVDNLFDKSITPPPAVQQIRAYNLNTLDQLFEGLRSDYPGFDDWLEKCMKEDRPTFIVNHPEDENYAALSVLKKETNNEFGLKGKVYKICTFKVVNQGIKLGELMLKTIFDYATNNNADHLYVEVFPKFEHLINLFGTFGFSDLARNKYNGELRLVKKINPTTQKEWDLSPFEFHVRFGPNKIKTNGVDFFIIPIQPSYHKLLFPEFESQSNLFPGKYSYGNSLRKAYLSNANTRQIHTGDVLLFYRSGDYKSITTIGIAENVFVSKNTEEIARFVGRRTVYSIDEIESLCKHGEVLSILFRQVKILKNRYTLKDLKGDKMLNGAPQSITKIDNKVKTWLENRLKT